ncbi:MAG: hypothetical protein GY720_18585 [bacterium]|nr:hypothetical protein [bacterium]
MTHYKLPRGLLAGLTLSVALAACGGGGAATPTRQLATPTLSATAIGAVDIGQPPGAAIDEITAIFGSPDEDSSWIDADSSLYGECPGVQLRVVGWGSLYLYFLADEPITPDNENAASRFYTFSYGYDFSRNEGATDPRDLNLVTETGIGLGSTRAELRTAHGGSLTETYDEEADTWTWSIDEPSGTFIAGLLSGPEDDATVVLMERVPSCGGA